MAPEPWHEQHLDGLRCPVCDGVFRLLHLMAKPEKPLRAIVRCSGCGQVGVGTVRIAGQVYPLVDHIATGTISDNDVTEIRDFLSGFDGNFQELFS